MKNFVSFLVLNMCLLFAAFGADEVEYRADLNGLSVRKRPSQQPAQEPAQSDEESSTTEPDYSDDEYESRVSGKVLGQLKQKENKANRKGRRSSEKSNHEDDKDPGASITTIGPRLKRTDKKQPSLSSLVTKVKSPRASASSLPNAAPTRDTQNPDDKIDIDAI